jgi:diacylglycerol kinase (ATP)
VALVANPGSGSGTAGSVAGLLAAQEADFRAYPPEQLSRVLEAAPERIVVAGGDGSIAPVADAAGRAGVPLAVIPVGTANDFARALELPSEVEEACRLAIHGTRELDLGVIDGRQFVNVASAGLPPEAAREAHGLKGTIGSLAYLIGAVRAGLRARPLRCSLTCDGEEVFSGKAWQVSAALTGAFGGGAEVEADPADGALDLVVIESGPRTALVRRAYGLRRGAVERQEAVVTRRCRRARLTVAAGTAFNVDGEVLSAGPVDLGVRPRAFRLVIG